MKNQQYSLHTTKYIKDDPKNSVTINVKETPMSEELKIFWSNRGSRKKSYDKKDGLKMYKKL